MKQSDIALLAVCALAFIFMGAVLEYAFKIGLPTVAYGKPDTVFVASKPDTTHDTIRETIISVSVKHDTTTQTVVSYPFNNADFNDSVQLSGVFSNNEQGENLNSTQFVTYSTGKRYLDGDSIGVSITSAELPRTTPKDLFWTLDRLKQADSCFNITRLDIVRVLKQARLGVGPSAGFGYAQKGGWSAFVGVSLNWNVLTF
jgi:hypothetical protein